MGRKTLLYHWMTAGVLLSLWACDPPEYLTEKELLDYVNSEESGLIQTQRAGGVDISVTFRPNDLVILQETGVYPDTARLQEARSTFGKYAYFIVQLSADGKSALYGDLRRFSEQLQTLSFGMGDRVDITTSEQDTVYVSDYVFDRTYGMGSTSMLFAFEKELLEKKEWISFNLHEFGMHTGHQHFRFQTADLQAIPKLKELQSFNQPKNR